MAVGKSSTPTKPSRTSLASVQNPWPGLRQPEDGAIPFELGRVLVPHCGVAAGSRQAETGKAKPQEALHLRKADI